MIDLCILFLLFISYSFIGWSIEVVLNLIEKKRFINRGFLIGPICPIYGWGSIFILVLDKYKEEPFTLFFMSVLICATLEYLTSYFMERIFHTRWWDYTDKRFNLNGRICLETMIPFGLLAMLATYIINPFLLSIIINLSSNTLIIITTVIFVVFIIDNIVSTNIIFNFRNTIKNIEKDATEEITKRVREIFLAKGNLNKRLIKAFPNAKTPKEHLQDIQKNISERLKILNKK